MKGIRLWLRLAAFLLHLTAFVLALALRELGLPFCILLTAYACRVWAVPAPEEPHALLRRRT